jgi:hypothetical protein
MKTPNSVCAVLVIAAAAVVGCSSASSNPDQGNSGNTGGTGDAGPASDGGSSHQDASSGATYSVGGTVTGLQGSGLVLGGDGVEDLSISAAGSFTFATSVASGSSYGIVVKSQPSNPSQTCTVASGAGTVSSAAVTGVAVTCVTNTYAVGGTITGLDGSGLTLQNGSDSVTVNGGATTFSFPTPVASGSSYAVIVSGNPAGPAQICDVTSGTDQGTVGGGDVNSVEVVCSTRSFPIGVTVTGLQGTGLVLTDNVSDKLTINTNGTFTFPKSVLSGGKYSVQVATPPASPVQSCTVASASGTVSTAAVNLAVTCSTATPVTVGGSVSGLTSGGLVLTSSTGGILDISTDGQFTFPAFASGSSYRVSISTQPPGQGCSISSNASGVATSSVSTIAVVCSTTSFAVGGGVTGLATNPITLLNNGVDPIAISTDGSFSFPTLMSDGATYDVTIESSLPGQTCTVANGAGTIAGASVANVTVTCTAPIDTLFTSGLIGYWRFDDAADATSAHDSSDNHLPSVISGSGVSFVPGAGKLGTGAASFSGSGFVDVTFPNDARGDGTGVFVPQGNVTYAMWFKVSGSTVEGLQMLHAGDGGCDRVVGNASPGGSLIYNAWQEDNPLGTAVVTDGAWHHVAYVMDEGVGLIGYVDGVLDASDSTPTNCGLSGGVGCSGFNWATEYWIGSGGGCRGNVGGNFSGLIDEVRLYDHPLTAAEVKALYDATK